MDRLKKDRRSIYQEGIRYNYTHVYMLVHKWESNSRYLQNVNIASEQETEDFKKEPERYSWLN